jgi:hypothetical protein
MGCRYHFSARHPGPNGETSGYKDYEEGETDPERRVCKDGRWVEAGIEEESNPGEWDSWGSS